MYCCAASEDEVLDSTSLSTIGMPKVRLQNYMHQFWQDIFCRCDVVEDKFDSVITMLDASAIFIAFSSLLRRMPARRWPIILWSLTLLFFLYFSPSLVCHFSVALFWRRDNIFLHQTKWLLFKTIDLGRFVLVSFTAKTWDLSKRWNRRVLRGRAGSEILRYLCVALGLQIISLLACRVSNMLQPEPRLVMSSVYDRTMYILLHHEYSIRGILLQQPPTEGTLRVSYLQLPNFR